MPGLIDLTGQRFGRLVVDGFAGLREKKATWSCRCDCGANVVAKSSDLRRARKKSCGCLLSDTNRALKTKHGHARKGNQTPEYKAWGNMRDRCYLTTHISYPHYGGRGIEVCDRWRNGDGRMSGFECFLTDLGPRPSKRHSIDRYPNVDGNYEPGNVRWGTTKEQARNRTDNIYVDIGGVRQSLPDACELLGLDYRNVSNRMSRFGWSFERASTQPVQRGGRR